MGAVHQGPQIVPALRLGAVLLIQGQSYQITKVGRVRTCCALEDATKMMF